MMMNDSEILNIANSFKLSDKHFSELEQYFTPPNLAINFLKEIDFKNKIVIDIGSGNGVLGLISLILGAKKVIFLDIDNNSINTSKENYSALKKNLNNIGDVIFLKKDISLLKKSEFSKIDICLMNPPFGTTKENKKIDLVFLKKAMKLSKKILTMHKTASKDFVKKIISENDFKIVLEDDFLFPINKIYKHHTKDKIDVEVTLFILEKN
jgi:putative methylase